MHDNVTKVYDFVLADRWMKVREIAEDGKEMGTLFLDSPGVYYIDQIARIRLRTAENCRATFLLKLIQPTRRPILQSSTKSIFRLVGREVASVVQVQFLLSNLFFPSKSSEFIFRYINFIVYLIMENFEFWKIMEIDSAESKFFIINRHVFFLKSPFLFNYYFSFWPLAYNLTSWVTSSISKIIGIFLEHMHLNESKNKIWKIAFVWSKNSSVVCWLSTFQQLWKWRKINFIIVWKCCLQRSTTGCL